LKEERDALSQNLEQVQEKLKVISIRSCILSPLSLSSIVFPSFRKSRSERV
jgi:hypothetical protein